MSWNLGTGGGSNAEFTKFPPGITKIRVLDEAPHMRWTHWMNQHKRSLNCPGAGCPICQIRKGQKANKEQYTYPMTRRFTMNIFNYETGKVEIMEQGIGFFEDLRDLKVDTEAEGKKLSDVIIKVRRRGTGKDDTSYRLDIEGDATEELPEEGIIDLAQFFQPNTTEQITRLVNGEAWDEVFVREEQTEETEEHVEVR